MMESLKFPKNFYFGAATSAHQVEGGNKNDWSEWENETAEIRLNNSSMEEIPDYLLSRHPSPLERDNYISGKACDHYFRFRQDFDLAKELGHNAHRFSIEWSRIEPEEGKWNGMEMDHYRYVIEALLERGMEPFLTVNHFTVPVWFRKIGGWKNKKSVEYFSRFVKKIAPYFKDGVKFWITINEPNIYVLKSYYKGKWPPNEQSFWSCLGVMKNLIRAHARAYEIIKEARSDSQIGIAQNVSFFEPYGNKIINRALKKIADKYWNYYFWDKTLKYHDFLGLNFYFYNRISYGFNKNSNKTVSDMRWEMKPDAVYNVLVDLANRYDKPVYITENGLADALDKRRQNFIEETLGHVSKAAEDGVDIRGYFHWSLMDNFEWDKGFWPRFGLIEIDYKTLERKIRPSAYVYKRIIEASK